MAYKPKILAFAGSLRRESYNKKLVKNAIPGAEAAGAEVTYIDLFDFPLPIYNGDVEEKEGLPANAIKLKKLMKESDGFIISCPEYNSSIPGVLKNTIDWVSRKETPDEADLVCFVDKVALIIGASPGPLGALRSLVHLRVILENIYTMVLPRQKVIPNAADAFDSQGNLKNSKDKDAIDGLSKKLVETIRKLKQ